MNVLDPETGKWINGKEAEARKAVEDALAQCRDLGVRVVFREWEDDAVGHVVDPSSFTYEDGEAS